jgi:hypothetical protein
MVEQLEGRARSPGLVEATDEPVDKALPSGRAPPFPIERRTATGHERENNINAAAGRHRAPPLTARGNVRLILVELRRTGRKIDDHPTIRKPTTWVGQDLVNSPEDIADVVAGQDRAYRASRGRVRAHHLDIIDPAKACRVPVLDRTITPRQPRHGHRRYVRDLIEVPGVEAKLHRHVVDQRHVDATRPRRRLMRVLLRLNSDQLRDDQLTSACAGSCHGQASNLRKQRHHMDAHRSTPMALRLAVYVLLKPSLRVPELRESGLGSATSGPPIALELGKRETVIGSARTTSVRWVRSGVRCPAAKPYPVQPVVTPSCPCSWCWASTRGRWPRSWEP